MVIKHLRQRPQLYASSGFSQQTRSVRQATGSSDSRRSRSIRLKRPPSSTISSASVLQFWSTSQLVPHLPCTS